MFKLTVLEGAFNPDAKNPFESADIPKTRYKAEQTRYSTLDTVVRMIEVLDEPAATVVAVAAFTGLRKSEIQGLRWEDLDGNQLHIQRAAWRTTKIDETKTASSAAPVPIIPVLADYLEAHRNGCPADGFSSSPAPSLARDRWTCITSRIALSARHSWRKESRGPDGMASGGVSPRRSIRWASMQKRGRLSNGIANVKITEELYTKAVSTVSQKAMRKIQAAFKAKLAKSKKKG